MQLSQATIAISGLGLMGSSLALALRGKCGLLIGVTRRPDLAERAIQTGVVDRATCDLAEVASQADIVVLATPVLHIIESIPRAAASMRPGSLLLDLGSTKRDVVVAMNAIPDTLLAVGGHPMCGKETGGLESADPSLFRGCTFVLSPTLRTTPEALALAHDLVGALEARPLVLDADRHDRDVAAISHLPYLLAVSLMHTGQQLAEQDPVLSDLAAGGFRDTTRLAASQVDMMLHILLTNHDAILPTLDLFERNLAHLRELLNDPPALEHWMQRAQDARRGMLK